MLRIAFLASGALAAASCETLPAGPAPTADTVRLRPATAEDIATITALEDGWSQAFLTKDMAFLESIVAPEFSVASYRNGRQILSGREEWMATTRRWEFRAHPTEVLNVQVVEDTSVATVRGTLVAAVDGREVRNNDFLVTDTWVRRNGRWQVIFRYADIIR